MLQFSSGIIRVEESGIATAHSTGDVMKSDEAGAVNNVFSTP